MTYNTKLRWANIPTVKKSGKLAILLCMLFDHFDKFSDQHTAFDIVVDAMSLLMKQICMT